MGIAPNKYVQGICPDSWHLPSDREWNALEKEIYENADKYSTYTSADLSTWNAVSPTPAWNAAWETAPTSTTRGSSANGGHAMAMQSSCPPIGITTDVPGKSYLANKEGGFDSLPVGCVPDTGLPSYGRSA